MSYLFKKGEDNKKDDLLKKVSFLILNNETEGKQYLYIT